MRSQRLHTNSLLDAMLGRNASGRCTTMVEERLSSVCLKNSRRFASSILLAPVIGPTTTTSSGGGGGGDRRLATSTTSSSFISSSFNSISSSNHHRSRFSVGGAGKGGGGGGSNMCGGSFLHFTTTRRFQYQRPTIVEIAAACKTLDCRVDCDEKKLKKQYLELVKKFHPDKAGGSEEKMKNISTAYSTIKSLSKAERASYASHQSGRSYSSGNQSQQRPGATYSGFHPNGPRSAGAAKSGSREAYDWQRMYEEQRRSRNVDYTNDFSRGGSRQQPGFNSQNFEQQLKRLLRGIVTTPLFIYMKRVLIVYLVIMVLFVFIYRRNRERTKEQEGWEMNEGLNRKERLEELYRMRGDVVDNVAGGNQQYSSPRMILEREKEKKVLEWANMKQKEMAELQRCGFSSFHPSLGYLHRKPEDPEGVVFFEPRSADSVYRALGKGGAPAPGGIGVGIAGGDQGPALNMGLAAVGGGSGEKLIDLRKGGKLHPFLGQPGGGGPLGGEDPQYMSPRNRELLVKRQREREMMNIEGRGGGGGDPLVHDHETLPPHLGGRSWPVAEIPDSPQEYRPLTHQRNNSGHFPPSAAEQVAAIQGRARHNPEGTASHEMPAGLRRAAASSTGAAYPELPVELLSVRPSPGRSFGPAPNTPE